ncbi:MAG: HAMP domain-containing protein, partial [Leptolyngbyaceae bacterium]|nr:HAMP domain-containing protein [Leptolyngbyaceae bacterium]
MHFRFQMAMLKARPSLARSVPLQWILVFPFVVQIFAAVGLLGYLSFRNGQAVVNTLVTQLLSEVNSRIEEQVDSRLAVIRKVQEMNVRAIQAGTLDVSKISPTSFKTTGKVFWNQIKTFDLTYIAYANADKEFIGAGYFYGAPEIAWLTRANRIDFYAIVPDDVGNPQGKITVQTGGGIDFFTDWYHNPISAGKTVWGGVYRWPTEPKQIAIHLGTPIYSNTKQLRGVAGMDISLSQINDFLRNLKIGQTGRTFIMERSGKLVATSSTQPSYKIFKEKAEQLLATESSDPLIQSAANHLVSDVGGLQTVKTTRQLSYISQGQRKFLIVTPYQDKYGLDWLIVTVVPEADFMAQINQNTQNTILLCLGALGVAIALGLLTSRWITKPILRLSAASQAIASGKLDQEVEVGNVDEVGILAQSFNQMASQLKQSFTALEESNEALEHRVEQR